MRHKLEYWFARTALASLRFAPRPVAERIGGFYARLLDLAVPRLRKVAYRNLSAALPSMAPEPIVDGLFASIGRMLVAFAKFPDLNQGNIHDWIRYEGFEHFLEAKRRGKGVLFATAHMGAWELSAFAHALMAEPMHVVVRPLDNPQIDTLVADRRIASGNTLVPKKQAIRAILKALHQNQAVGVLIDQNASRDEGAFVDFFGTKACAGTAFVRIAASTGAAVIPGFALWSEAEHRFILRFYPLLKFTGEIEKDTQLLHSRLERVIREYPEQWLWIHRRWKTRPEGESSFY